MSIYGIGAYFGPSDGQRIYEECVKNNVVCIGHDKSDPKGKPVYEMFRAISAGDTVYIKVGPNGKGRRDLRVKAVGLVRDLEPEPHPSLVWVRSVIWLWLPKDDGYVEIPVVDANNVRSNTLYCEYNPIVIDRIMDLVREARNGGD